MILKLQLEKSYISFQHGIGVNSQRWNVTLYVMIYYYTYRDLKLQLTEWLTFNFNEEERITFQLLSSTPYIMIYIAYRDLKA